METKKIIPLRLRHSNLEVLHTCERKFQLDNLLVNEMEREESEHLSFGTAFGVGVAHYLVNQDPDMALFEAWLAYWPQVETDKKSVPICMNALMGAFIHLDTILMNYEVASFNGKPAIELGFKLRIADEYYFTGHIDVVLRHRYSGVHYILDAKTTGLQLFDLSPLYRNSGQCLGYSIALDKIVGEKQASYGVLYFVAQIGRDPFNVKHHTLVFDKTLLDRLNWFMTLGLDVRKLQEMEELNVYPRRGHSCLHFNRPCKYFGTCTLQSLDFPKIQREDIGNDGLPAIYDFEYDLNDLITEHLARLPQEQMEELI